jgi:serine/threonine protein kinase/tetratricopeptide (TPR) repeat protein
MEPANANAAGLAPDELQWLEALLQEFDLKWEEGGLARRAGGLPGDGPLRRASLAGMVKIDLRRQWQLGRKKLLEDYLREYPELGNPETVPLDLIQAEVQARGQAGEAVSWADLAQRFPRQTEQMRRGLDQFFRNPAPAAPPSPAVATKADTNSCELGTLRPEPGSEVGMSGPSAPPPPREADRYRILKELGRGAMGSVYLAEDTQMQRLVAMKQPHFRSGENPDLDKRFYREAYAAAALHHPSICPVYDVGERDGRLFLTMAYIEGQTLDKVLRARKPLPQRRTIEIVCKLADALEEAHHHGVVHRDLKPSNVMIDRRGDPVIMDFGLARRMEQDVRLTHEGSVLGTPAYMSPEQVQGERDTVGPTSDQYSLGVILYELLTGQLPFQGTMGQIMARILTEAPRPPSSLRPDLDLAVEKVCLKAMAREPAARYPSVAEFGAALAHCLEVGSKTSPDVISSPGKPRTDFTSDTVPGTPPSEESITPPPPPPWWRRRALAVLVGAVLVLLLGTLGYLLWLLGQDARTVTVAIHWEPADATAYFDGHKQGPAPDGKFSLSPGKHELRLERAGYHPLRAELFVRAEDAGRPFRYELKKIEPPPPAAVEVRIRSDPAGADVFLDGKRLPQRTEAKLSLAPGVYELRLERDGYEPRTVKLEVPAGSAGLAFDYTLSRLARDVVLRVTPPDARVEIDGKAQSPGKGGLVRLTVGKHRLGLSRDNYKPRMEDIEVRAGDGPQHFEFELEALRSVKYALLVGVHQPAGGLPDFLHAEPDVAELGRLLVAGGYDPAHVVVLTQTRGERDKALRPDAATVREGLRALRRRCTPADSVVVALVGHAVQPPGADASAFCPAGADLKDPKTLLSLAEVYEEMRQCKARSRLLLLDCWRQGEGGLPRPRVVAPGGDFSVLLACSAGEFSYEHPEERHGAFLASVLRGLLEPGDGTLAGLADGVKKRVGALVKREYGAAQTPELVGGPADAARPPLHLGEALTAFGRALGHLEKAGRLKDGPEMTDEYGGAVEALDRAVAADGKFVAAYTRRAEVFYRLEKFKKAAADCRRALDLDPDNATAHSQLGESLTMLEKYADALASHEKAIKLEPAYPPAHNERGQTHFKARQFPEAIKDFSEAIRLKPRFKWAHLNRGYAHYQLKDADAAIADETSAIKLDAALPDAWRVRGMARMLKKQPQEYEAAVTDFSRVIDLEPVNASAYLWRAQAHAALGNNAAAKADREMAKKLREKQKEKV